MTILPKTNYYDPDLALAIATKVQNDQRREQGTLRKEDLDYEQEVIKNFTANRENLDIDKFYNGAEAGHFIKRPLQMLGSINVELSNLLKDFYEKTSFIGKSVMFGGLTGLVLSIPMALKGKVLAVKDMPILGALAGGIGSGLFVQNKKTEDVEKASKLISFEGITKTAKNTVCGGLIGLTTLIPLMITNGIKNKTFNLFKNLGTKAKLFAGTGAAIGFLIGAHKVTKNKIEEIKGKNTQNNKESFKQS